MASSAALSKLAWMASRPGQKGHEAMRVLQDALLETYPTELQVAIAKASKRDRINRREAFALARIRKPTPFYILFAPSMERAIRKYPNQRGRYRRNHWPFVVAHTLERRRFRRTVVPIWNSAQGFL